MKEPACWPVDNFAEEESIITSSPQSRKGFDTDHSVLRQVGMNRSAGWELRHKRVGALIWQMHLEISKEGSAPTACISRLQRQAG